MESSNGSGLNRTASSPVKSEQRSSNTEFSRTASSPAKSDTPNANLSSTTDTKPSPSSSSSPDSTLNHPNSHKNDADNNDDSSSTSSTSPSQKSNENPTPPKPDESSLLTAAPPHQEMERSASKYRIPSSVFERSKSSTPMEWSTASNESLFSIHMGTMSFTNDHYHWRSGELCAPVPEASTSPDQIFSYSAEKEVAADMRSRELGIAEATMLEVIKESELGRNHENSSPPSSSSLAEARNARRSEEGNTSNKSYAFSVMGGDTGRVTSSVRSSNQQSKSQQMTPDLKSTPPENAPQRRWFSCFSLCSPRR